MNTTAKHTTSPNGTARHAADIATHAAYVARLNGADTVQAANAYAYAYANAFAAASKG